MTFGDLRRRADVVRDIPLPTVLVYRGAVRDRRDRAKWQTEQGPVSVSGSKFINWHRHVGGGGAIDLVMHLGGMDFPAAVAWLEEHLGIYCAAATTTVSSSANSPADLHPPGQLRLPVPDHLQLLKVRRYLLEQRGLAARLLDPLIEAGKLYADQRANAVFLLVAGKANRPIGAELRGTGKRVWRGMAPGTRKDRGYFWIGARAAQQIVLCESAIDAISCFQLLGDRICISTSGARANPRWLPALITRSYTIWCGFDTDITGEAAAREMIARHPSVERLIPPAHDWNAALVSRH